MIRGFLDRHWKLLTISALALGFSGWILWGWIAWDAYSNPAFGKWVTQLDFNAYGEGPFELFVMIPIGSLIMGAAIYAFLMKSKAN